MTTFLMVLGVYIATLIYLNFKIKPDGEKLPAELELARKAMTATGRLIHLLLLTLGFTALWLTGQYLLHLLGYADHPFPN